MDLYALGAEPVNFAAACLLFKSPWWAKAPEEAKKELRKHAIAIDVFANVTRNPPDKYPNRIGEIIHDSIVIGYAWTRKFGTKGKKGRPLGPCRSIPGLKEHHSKQGDKLYFYKPDNTRFKPVWYVLFPNGMIKPAGAGAINNWGRMPYGKWKEWWQASAGEPSVIIQAPEIPGSQDSRSA